MSKLAGHALASMLLAALLAAGCKPKPSAPSSAPSSALPSATSAAYFKTPFQTESQFIVESVVADLAEEMFYAGHHRLPDKKQFSVTAAEKRGTPDAPAYDLQIRLDPKQADLKLEVSLSGPVWSPAAYQAVAAELGRAAGLSATSTTAYEDLTLVSQLTDGTAESVEEANRDVSAMLEKDFGNPELHENAALLLGAFLLRDHSGNFFEIRSPLSRMTAHLAMARFLRGPAAAGVKGRLAEAMLLTLINDEALALEQLQGVGGNDPGVTAMVRALRARNTGDYRPLDQLKNRTPVESAEWFCARAASLGVAVAWPKLSDDEQQTVDFVRMANQMGYSVQVGHQLLEISLPLELKEINRVYELAHHEKLSRSGLVKALNEMPERCFSSGPGGQDRVRVIGWGQWAMFLQRHLCHAAQQGFNFMANKWGVPDEAAQFAAKCDQELGGLRLYPLVRRFTATEEDAYHKAVDEGFKLTVNAPQLVPAGCWNALWTQVRFAPVYAPTRQPHIDEWFSHEPPPGTVYDLPARLIHRRLSVGPDVVARFEKLRVLAPYDGSIANFLLSRKYGDRATYDQAMALFGPILPYSVPALRVVARTVYQQPEQYEKLMLQAAELSPVCYYDLADYEISRGEEDRGAQYLEQACSADPDAVRVSNKAVWRVRYFLKKGRTDTARKIADEAGEVYSGNGLAAKAIFLEATTNYAGAFEWYAKLEERYDQSYDVIDFCLRYKLQTGDTRFDKEVQKRLGKLFPKGIEKVALKDFQGPPADGVLVAAQNDLVVGAGMKTGDVIVAVYGVRVRGFLQYAYGRALKSTPELDLIVWQGDAYHELKPSLPPDHLFGVSFGDYVPK